VNQHENEEIIESNSPRNSSFDELRGVFHKKALLLFKEARQGDQECRGKGTSPIEMVLSPFSPARGVSRGKSCTAEKFSFLTRRMYITHISK